MIYNETIYNKHWTEKKLNELGEFARGKSKHRPRNDKKLFDGGGYPLVQTGDIKNANLYLNQHSKEYNDFGLQQSKLWGKGTLCITIAANIAECAILNYPMCFPDSIVGFIPYKNMCSSEFMYYLFAYIKSSVQSSASGSIQDNINLEYLSNLKLRIPDLNYQNKIVKILKNLDDKININNKLISKTNNIIGNIFNYYSNMNDDSYKKLKDFDVKIITGKTPSTKQISNFGEDVPFITIDDIRDNMYITDTTRKLSISGAESQKNKYIKENSICVSCIATVGEIGITTCLSQTNQQINSIEVSNKELYYLYCYLKNYFNNTANIKQGNIFDNLSKDEFSNIDIKIINDERLNEFNKYVEPLFKRIKEVYLETNKLRNIREKLLPLLMNGQIKLN